MKEFRGKAAVISGAAGGIGWALAERCAQEGMQVADVEEEVLARAERELKARGASGQVSLLGKHGGRLAMDIRCQSIGYNPRCSYLHSNKIANSTGSSQDQ